METLKLQFDVRKQFAVIKIQKYYKEMHSIKNELWPRLHEIDYIYGMQEL